MADLHFKQHRSESPVNVLSGTDPPCRGPLLRQGECTSRLLISLEARTTRHLARPKGLQSYQPGDNDLLDRFGSWRPDPSAIAINAFLFPLKGRELLLLPSHLLHPSATPRGAPTAGDNNSGRLRSAGSMAARSQPDAHRSSSLTPNRLHAEHRLDPHKFKTDLLQDLGVVYQALGHPQEYIDSVVRPN